MTTLLFLWRHPYGRLALASVLVGAVGLVFHYWSGVPLLAALPRTSWKGIG